jgi:Uncharacterized protein conserved in bacteria (DUF2252)
VDIRTATQAYERWLGARVPLVPADMALKHRLMAANVFSFLRATFYRWAQHWPEVCAELAGAPQVLAVGDLHVENFGTWRDAEGRLIWGVNDFDEVVQLPYTQDLVRLATSALVAVKESRLCLPARRACQSILEGYTESLGEGGAAAVLAERHRWLRELAVARLKAQRPYWQHLRSLRTVAGIDPRVRRLLAAAMPAPGVKLRLVHRQAGAGSLGRQRILALADWRGGMIAREAKPLTTSAWLWARSERPLPPRYAELLARALRVPDPFLALHGEWLIRRLAPDCSRIELSSLPRGHDERRLLWMMGWETANIHLGSPRQRRRILGDLGRRKPVWLLRAAGHMAAELEHDWRKWRKSLKAK